MGEGVGAGSAVAALVGSVAGTAGGGDGRATHATSETRGTSASSRLQHSVGRRIDVVTPLFRGLHFNMRIELLRVSCVHIVVHRRWMERIRVHDDERTLFKQSVQVFLPIIPHERDNANPVQELMVLSFFCRVISSISSIPFRASHCPCLCLIHRQIAATIPANRSTKLPPTKTHFTRVNTGASVSTTGVRSG